MVLQSEQCLGKVRVGFEELLLEAFVLHLVAAEPAHRIEVTVDDDRLDVLEQSRHVGTAHLVLRSSDEVSENTQSA